jgi:hypothetical protein
MFALLGEVKNVGRIPVPTAYPASTVEAMPKGMGGYSVEGQGWE